MAHDFTVTNLNIEPFKSLRTTPWKPSFDWVDSERNAAERINSWHENGNEHITQTSLAIFLLETVGEWTGLAITEHIIKRTHTEIFPGEKWTGKWRDVNVRVGPHKAPHPNEVSWLMSRSLLDVLVHGDALSIGMLLEWYYAFETIHPFQDGNGWVGGAIVAAYSHIIEPDKGWLAVNQ